MLNSQLTNFKSKLFLNKKDSLSIRSITTQPDGSAKIIDGKSIANQIKQELKQRVSLLSTQPILNIIQVGDRPDSTLYTAAKQKMATEIGIKCNLHKLSETITQHELETIIEGFNEDDSTGLLVQLPFPPHLNPKVIVEKVDPEKDVDGFHPLNVGALVSRSNPLYVPCTPKACVELLLRSGVEISGKRAVVIGRSMVVGTPVFHLLNAHDATVTLCHRKTKNIEDIVKEADILVVAVGQPEFVKKEWIKPGAVVIDVGINSVIDSSTRSGSKLVGDVDADVADSASLITPVPGGVGPMTVMMLMSNLVEAAEKKSKEKKSIRILPLNIVEPVPKDYEISTKQIPKHISELAKSVGIKKNELSLYGPYKAKVSLKILDRLKDEKEGKYVVVTGINPTSFGEGKTVTTIGLCQALTAALGKVAFGCLRQPSMGPTFGIKGGAAGGGYSQIIPMEDMNMHLTGDIHAIGLAHNLASAAIDARIFHEKTQTNMQLFNRICPLSKETKKRSYAPLILKRMEKLGINPENELTETEIEALVRLDFDVNTISWSRVLDVNDRFLREITVGQSPTEKGFSRKTSFDITVASEIMAVLGLCTDIADLKQRLGNIIVGSSIKGVPITMDDLGITGALAALLKDATEPTMVQTIEGTPVFVHAGPFANIAHGASSIVADRIALKLADYVVTEAGFGADIGFEKFVGIKCRDRRVPDAAVMVVTVRALESHGTDPENKLLSGCQNMVKHIKNIGQYGVPAVVAINRFTKDSIADLELIQKVAREAGAFDAVICENWARGGEGAAGLATSVINACEGVSKATQLYELESSIQDKITTIATKLYGASSVKFSDQALNSISEIEKWGKSNLPVCMAKTQYSFSHDPEAKGVPAPFELPVRDVILRAGAGFITVMCGSIQTMPGLPTRPAFYDIDLDVNTKSIVGLF